MEEIEFCYCKNYCKRNQSLSINQAKRLKNTCDQCLECPTCKSPDTKILKENRISFLICEACGAKSTLKGKYA